MTMGLAHDLLSGPGGGADELRLQPRAEDVPLQRGRRHCQDGHLCRLRQHHQRLEQARADHEAKSMMLVLHMVTDLAVQT